jgi:serpin B
MPYEGWETNMAVVLPRKVDGLAEVERSLTEAKLRGWAAGLGGRQVTITMPKFKTVSSFGLKPLLSALGMPLAFGAGRADFSGMTDAKPAPFIQAVLHKAYVSVYEEGTEAAAATRFYAEKSAERPEESHVFTADHPFLWLIRHQETGAILFMGRVVNPKVE